MVYLGNIKSGNIFGERIFSRKFLFGQSGPERGRNCLLGLTDHIEDIWLPIYGSKVRVNG
jgi:hypothetical protein